MFTYFRKLIEVSDKERYATEALAMYARDHCLVSVRLRDIWREDAGNLKDYDKAFAAFVKEKEK